MPSVCSLLGARSACEAGEVALLDELERRAAAGAHVVDPVGEAELADRRGAVAATDDRERRGTPATASATARVPAANGASSNMPIGPFQSTVAASATTSAYSPRSRDRRRGPSSRRGSRRRRRCGSRRRRRSSCAITKSAGISHPAGVEQARCTRRPCRAPPASRRRACPARAGT